MSDLLLISLHMAVPLRIMELEQLESDERERLFDERRMHDVNLIASKSDILMYGGGKPGDVAEVHTALVNAIARLSFAEGGVTVFGMHFEARR